EASGGETVTIEGVKSAEGLTINGNVVTVAAKSLGTKTVTISNDYELALDDDVQKSEIKPAGWTFDNNVATYKKESTSAGYTLDNKQIVYKTASGGEAVTIEGVKSAEGLTLNDNIITVAAKSLGAKTVTISEGYELALDDDVPKPEKQNGSWTFSGSTATYTNTGTTAGYILEDNQIKYVPDGNKETIEVKGVVSKGGLSIDGKKVTVDETALNKENVTISEGYELELGKVTTPKDTKPTWSFKDGIATYMSSGTTAGYVLENNQIVYKEASDGTSAFRISGVTSTDGITVEGKIVTVNAASLGREAVTVSEGYELKLGDAPAPKDTAANWESHGTTATYTGAGSTAGYVLENNEISYIEANDRETFTINGVISTDGISINDKEVTINAESLGTETVTISEGYTLKLGSNVKAPTTSAASWELNGNIAGCKVSTTEGYTLVANKITYIPTNNYDNFTVNGVKSTDGLTLNGTTVTVGNAALGSSTITISDGYELKLGNDVNKAATTSATWSYDKGTSTVTYTSGLRSAGYLLEDNHISYVSEIKGEEVKISGVSSKDGIAVEDKVITISASALNKKPVEVDNQNYTLKLGADVSEPTTKKAGWTLDGTTATYKTASTTEGYSIEDNKIKHVDSSGGKVLATVEGVKDILGLALEDKIVKVYDSALSGSEVKLSGEGYELAFGEDVKQSATKNDWIIDDDKLTYQAGATSAGYKLSSDKKSISYAESVKGTVKVELSGAESKPTFADEEKTIIQFTADNFSEDGISVATNEGEYKFDIAEGDYATDTKFVGSEGKDTVTNAGNALVIELGAAVDKLDNSGANVLIDGGLGNDRINNSGAGVSVIGGKGNDNITLGGGNGGNVFVYNTGDGKDIITGVSKNDTIKISGSKQISANVKGNDVVLNVDSGSVTFKNAAAGMKFNVVDSENKAIEAISGNSYSTSGVISGDMIKLSSTFEGKYTADEIDMVDGSQLTTGIIIDAGTEGISLLGGTGKDTLISGEKEFELTGGKGNDVFVFSGKSNGKITDYSQKGKDGKDKISTDGLTFRDYEIEGKNVLLTYSDGKNTNTLTIENGIGKEITFTNKTVNRYEEIGIFDGNGKSVSLASDTTSFKAKDYPKMITIEGSAANEVEIIGNKKANYIKAGSGGSTINGGKGNDTLVGGDGNDIFVYDNKSGNKLIQNYGDGDIISLTGGASISEVKVIGKDKQDLELKVGSNKITIAGGKGSEFTFNDGEEKTFTANGLLVSGKTASLTSSFAGKSEELIDYQNVNAGLLKKGFSLTAGTETNNSLIGSKGNDTLTAGTGGSNLWGGKGNDVLYGGEGYDTFIFHAGDGTDTIFNYSEGDMLTILDKRGKEFSKGVSPFTKSVFSGGTLTLSVKGGGKVVFSGVSNGEGIKINGDTHYISGKTLK
ncbi:MAG: calcium-binding protein, partial [Selenomonadaceae bacterium]|nr:calcium-binding protein [Selenomonadaceae bacterium]